MRNILAEPVFEPAADGWEARTIPLSNADPPIVGKGLTSTKVVGQCRLPFPVLQVEQNRIGLHDPVLSGHLWTLLGLSKGSNPFSSIKLPRFFCFWKRTLNKTRQKGALLCFDVFQLTNIWSNWSISHKIHFSGNRADKSWMFARL